MFRELLNEHLAMQQHIESISCTEDELIALEKQQALDNEQLRQHTLYNIELKDILRSIDIQLIKMNEVINDDSVRL